MRLDIVQVLRGLAALVVCLAHIVRTSPDAGYPRALDMFGSWGDVGVYGFFLISGLVVPWSLDGQRYSLSQFPRFLARRLVRLDPPYLVTLVIALCLAWYHTVRDNAVYPEFPYSVSTIALHLGYLTGVADRQWILPIFWTLGIEFQFYILIGLLFPAVAWLMARTSGRSAWPSTFAWLWVLTIVPPLVQVQNLDAHVLAALWTTHFQFFTVGFSLFLLKRERAHWSLPVLVTLFNVGHGGLSGNTDDIVLVRNVTLALVMSAAIGLTANRLEWMRTTSYGHLLNGLGAVSYSLYLTHILVIGRITAVAVSRGWTARPGLALLVVLAETVVAVGAAALFHLLIERPAVRWSRRISYSAPVADVEVNAVAAV